MAVKGSLMSVQRKIHQSEFSVASMTDTKTFAEVCGRFCQRLFKFVTLLKWLFSIYFL